MPATPEDRAENGPEARSERRPESRPVSRSEGWDDTPARVRPARRAPSRRSTLSAVAAATLAAPLIPPAPRAAAVTTSAGATSAGATDPAADTVAADAGEVPALRTMTFNLRYASDTPPHTWAERRPVTRELLRRERPHLLGTQEGLYGQLRDIAADLGAPYAWLGTGRQGGSRDEFMAVFYDTRRLEPQEYDHFWLSDTPYVIGSNTWGGAVVRMVTWIRFRDLRTGRRFYALNTHLDHRGQQARERSAELITRRLAELDPALPRVVTGDFNVPAHGNPVYAAMLNGGALVDSWDAAERRGRLYGTFHGYRPPVPDGERIDWILTSPGVRTRYAAINTFSPGGRFPSDHLPVQAVLEI
ncbi:endonuclease/exonuclease/phosphatase family protein [Streptomyces sp. LX-29]|uniref:endonuclease/exonuclease/phosphatase family protein n=1 Tax=Streptomyces sp. LX-29 TaxID=2900152 RepID=UPI00240E2744|nr:endonuclease/exonuclease/phosphatase family protein [Streptomyces sp. LX-29]WFB06486.1 endonuclease/exonuclease/phosphatase family protein [Streptomyces sp. LX-29]